MNFIKSYMQYMVHWGMYINWKDNTEKNFSFRWTLPSGIELTTGKSQISQEDTNTTEATAHFGVATNLWIIAKQESSLFLF